MHHTAPYGRFHNFQDEAIVEEKLASANSYQQRLILFEKKGK
jgi:hypothetical protein